MNFNDQNQSSSFFIPQTPFELASGDKENEVEQTNNTVEATNIIITPEIDETDSTEQTKESTSPIVSWHQTEETDEETKKESEEEKTYKFSTADIKTKVLLIQKQLAEILSLLDGKKQEEKTTNGEVYEENGEKVVEGEFNGVSMVGPDGHEYSIPPNYASKSRLVEGDKMKLTIKDNGSFLYKQIGPIERKRITGTLVYDDAESQWLAMCNGKPIKLITASVTFYKGKVGDDVIVLIPEDKESKWGAIENIIKK